ncbi:MAG: hypothetical protein ACLFPQ_03530 [Candidatus Woesearchaeota archaeon]
MERKKLHRRDKESKRKENIILAAVFIVLVFAVGFLLSRDSGDDNYSDLPGDYDSFAKCLSESGMIMYGSETCGACNSQKNLFGSSFQYVNYIDCYENRAACTNAEIQYFPTWIYQGEKYVGVKSIQELSDITGCAVAS